VTSVRLVGNSFDQVVAVVVDAQGRFVDFDDDDLAGVAQLDLDALADDLGAPRRRRRGGSRTVGLSIAQEI
jgi:hypothetical protein